MWITEMLRAEHGLLRSMMRALGDWLAQSAPVPALRERAVMLSVGLEDHARREEQRLFEPLSAKSSTARNWVDMMEIVHDEVRGLFEEIAGSPRDPTDKLWTILQLTEEHFVKEENEVFPLAEDLIDSETLTQLAAAATEARLAATI
jgi:hemerythrin-like domain-containing protein